MSGEQKGVFRYFICALADKVLLAIPADLTEKIVPAAHLQNTGETASPLVKISLPELFHLPDTDAPHGLVLKSADAAKTVLLMPRIDKDIEIPEERIHQLPKVFSGLFRYFSGAYVDDQAVILVLDPEKIVAGVT